MNPTLEQLYAAIRADVTISELDKMLLIEKVRRETRNASSRSSLRQFLSRAGGGLLGNLITKYFGMGTLGRTAATLAGIGIGPRIDRGLFGR